MTALELERIESELGVTLPRQYRRFARSLPVLREDSDSFVTAFCDSEVLISENRSLRSDENWAPYLFSIGPHDGNHFFIDLRNPTASVFYRDHEESFSPADFASRSAGSLEDLRDQIEEAATGGGFSMRKLCRSWRIILQPFRRPTTFRTGLSLTWTSAGLERVERLDSPTSVTIAAEIRRFFEGSFGELHLHFDPSATWYCPVDFLLIGGGGRCAVQLRAGRRWHQFLDAQAPDRAAILLEKPAVTEGDKKNLITAHMVFRGQEAIGGSERDICRDVDLIIAAACHLHEKGRLLKDFLP